MEQHEVVETEFLRAAINDGASYYSIITIFYLEKWWLAPKWNISLDGQWLVPERIISLDNFRFLDLRTRSSPAEFLVQTIVPQGVLYGFIDDQDSHLELIDRPKICVPNYNQIH